MSNANPKQEATGFENPKQEATGSENKNSATMNEQTSNAADSTAEDTLDAYKSMMNQMKAQNDSLLEANKSLQSQISLLIRNGSSVVQNSNLAGNEQSADDNEPYVSLTDLGSELGKRDYRSHNQQKE